MSNMDDIKLTDKLFNETLTTMVDLRRTILVIKHMELCNICKTLGPITYKVNCEDYINLITKEIE